ncbi:MAG TPA: hypothetical protein VNV86_17215 [Candidatus Acidoferrum sp.]|nr:hypothetical protein [Candidatus Acidoferrum sp.]
MVVVHYGRGTLLPLGAVAASAVVRAQAPRIAPRFAIGRVVPGLSSMMVVNHVRAMLAVLDAWRFEARDADPAAWPILSILVGIALSTQAQCGADFTATR